MAGSAQKLKKNAKSKVDSMTGKIEILLWLLSIYSIYTYRVMQFAYFSIYIFLHNECLSLPGLYAASP